MAILKEEVKMYITQCLACYDVPSQVVESVKEEFGLELERSHVQFYDPTKKQGGSELGKKYRQIFEETRKAFLEDITKIPIASQSFRLRSLQRSYVFFTQRKNYVAANQVLEQAAKEVGGFYTNKMKLGTELGDPLTEWLKTINGGSIQVVEDGEIIENEVKQVESKPKFKPKGK
jgi:hypothetical protein